MFLLQAHIVTTMKIPSISYIVLPEPTKSHILPVYNSNWFLTSHVVECRCMNKHNDYRGHHMVDRVYSHCNTIILIVTVAIVLISLKTSAMNDW